MWANNHPLTFYFYEFGHILQNSFQKRGFSFSLQELTKFYKHLCLISFSLLLFDQSRKYFHITSLSLSHPGDPFNIITEREIPTIPSSMISPLFNQYPPIASLYWSIILYRFCAFFFFWWFLWKTIQLLQSTHRLSRYETTSHKVFHFLSPLSALSNDEAHSLAYQIYILWLLYTRRDLYLMNTFHTQTHTILWVFFLFPIYPHFCISYFRFFLLESYFISGLSCLFIIPNTDTHFIMFMLLPTLLQIIQSRLWFDHFLYIPFTTRQKTMIIRNFIS